MRLLTFSRIYHFSLRRYLLQDSSIAGENVVVSKANGMALGSAGLIGSLAVADLYKVTNPMDLMGLQNLILPNDAQGSYRIFQINSMELVPNVSLILNTTMPVSGSIFIDSSGIHEIAEDSETTANVTSNGRRLLLLPPGPSPVVSAGLNVQVVYGYAGQFGYTTPPVVLPPTPGLVFAPPPILYGGVLTG